MRVPFLDLQAQYRELAAEIDQAVHEVISSGGYVMGKYNKELETKIAARHGVIHAIAVNSGTDALRIMMQAAGIGPGDEVITTAFTFVASVEAIVQLGAVPVFVEIDPATFNMDPARIEASITSRTKAILPIHLFGQLCEMEPIVEIASRHGLQVLEDAAQTVHTHRKGTYCGAFGKAAAISFYVTKNLGAAGDGGLILTQDDEIAERSRSLRIHGMGRERYYYDDVGYTSRMAEVQAAFLVCKLSALDRWNARRAELAAQYEQNLADTGVQTPLTLPGNSHTWHQYTIQTSGRDELQAFLKERGIDSMIYYPVPIHLHAPYRHYATGPLELTERISQRVLSLPIHQHLTEEQVAHVCGAIREFRGSAVGSR